MKQQSAARTSQALPSSVPDLTQLIAVIGSANPQRVLEFNVDDGRIAKAVLRELWTVDQYVGTETMQRKDIPGWLALDDGRFQLVLRERGSLDLTYADLMPRYDAIIIACGASAAYDTAMADELINPLGGVIVWHGGNPPEGRALHRLPDAWFAFERMPR